MLALIRKIQLSVHFWCVFFLIGQLIRDLRKRDWICSKGRFVWNVCGRFVSKVYLSFVWISFEVKLKYLLMSLWNLLLSIFIVEVSERLQEWSIRGNNRNETISAWNSDMFHLHFVLRRRRKFTYFLMSTITLTSPAVRWRSSLACGLK